MNAYAQKMFMKRENIANKGIWTAKKRYILNVWNSEGVQYAQPKLKMMGIEAVKSSTPAPCRVAIKEALNVIMTGSEEKTQEYIKNFRQKFEAMPPELLSPVGVTTLPRIHHLPPSMARDALCMCEVHCYTTSILRRRNYLISILSFKREKIKYLHLGHLTRLTRMSSHSFRPCPEF